MERCLNSADLLLPFVGSQLLLHESRPLQSSQLLHATDVHDQVTAVWGAQRHGLVWHPVRIASCLTHRVLCPCSRSMFYGTSLVSIMTHIMTHLTQVRYFLASGPT